MGITEAAGADRKGFCLDCNYPLRFLAENRCPECGRAFDPNDPKTMKLGRPIGPVARMLMRPIGRWVIGLSLLALAAMLLVTHFPLGAPTLVEARYSLHLSLWKTRDPARTWQDWTYLAGLLLTIAAIAIYATRLMLLLAAMRVHRRSWPGGWEHARRHAVVMPAIAMAVISVLSAWPYRMGRVWIAKALTLPEGTSLFDVPDPMRIPLSKTQKDLARRAALRLPTAPERLEALNLLVHYARQETPDLLVTQVQVERDPTVCAAELHLLALCGHIRAEALFEQMMSDPRSAVRAAAADGLGFRIRRPSNGSFKSRICINESCGHSALATTPPIDAWEFYNARDRGRLTWTQRNALMRMMLAGNTGDEREAAARGLLAYPPDNYQLRVAEWGVWVNDGKDLKLTKALLDQIPRFVHGAANPASEFKDRIYRWMSATKPVVHITVNEPMALDISVLIRAGRPWFVYPRPDDFSVGIGVRPGMYMSNHALNDFRLTAPAGEREPLDGLDNPRLDALTDIREGYPWLTPHHKGFAQERNGIGEIRDIGLHWQSLIASPEKLSWMSPPPTGGDPKYEWWNALRKVPCSWLCNRGESDRFLFYDGPTLAKSPVDVQLHGDTLAMGQRALPRNGWLPGFQRDPDPKFPTTTPFIDSDIANISPKPGNDYTRRDGLFIRVVQGRVTARRVDVPGIDANIDLKNIAVRWDDSAIDALREIIHSRGFTDAETEGLIFSWKHQFFETDGQRFLLLLSPADYDALCPIEIRPAPTQMIRVGIVLTEFPVVAPGDPNRSP